MLNHVKLCPTRPVTVRNVISKDPITITGFRTDNVLNVNKLAVIHTALHANVSNVNKATDM